MGIDPIRSAGQQCAVICPGNRLQIFPLLGQRYHNLIHPVAQFLLQDPDIKSIADLQFPQIRKQLRPRKSGMGRQHSMVSFPANGKG